MTGKGKHTLIFGASGISGWSLMKQCLSYPSPSTFHRVTGLCNRHIEKETLLLPNDSRLNIVSGIDLTGSVEIVMEQLKPRWKTSCWLILFSFAVSQRSFHSFKHT
jgi:nucleoside-diphosphate-sugar epimerase